MYSESNDKFSDFLTAERYALFHKRENINLLPWLTPYISTPYVVFGQEKK